MNEKSAGYLDRWHAGETAAALLAEAQQEYTQLGLRALSLSLIVEMFLNQRNEPMDLKGLDLARQALADYRSFTGRPTDDGPNEAS